MNAERGTMNLKALVSSAFIVQTFLCGESTVVEIKSIRHLKQNLL
jgi:hypothetical protein